MTSRIKSWTCRFLSYAGRVQLVKSILFATQVYWSSLFILPKGVIKKIEQVLHFFGRVLMRLRGVAKWLGICCASLEKKEALG